MHTVHLINLKFNEQNPEQAILWSPNQFQILGGVSAKLHNTLHLV
jgi:hypothetical protein